MRHYLSQLKYIFGRFGRICANIGKFSPPPASNGPASVRHAAAAITAAQRGHNCAGIRSPWQASRPASLPIGRAGSRVVAPLQTSTGAKIGRAPRLLTYKLFFRKLRCSQVIAAVARPAPQVEPPPPVRRVYGSRRRVLFRAVRAGAGARRYMVIWYCWRAPQSNAAPFRAAFKGERRHAFRVPGVVRIHCPPAPHG